MKVAIIGVTGYSGLELIRLLHHHPQVEIVSIHSQSLNGQPIDTIYPHLKNFYGLTLEIIDPEKIMKTCDLVFFATPSGVSKEVALTFVEKKFPVIDLSGDFRLNKNGEYEQWYGKKGAPESFIQAAEYGLAEFRDRPQATFIANPGCYATATLLSLAPLIKNNWIEENSVIVDAKSGVSGAGKKLSQTSHFTEINENMLLYKMNSHQHIPEIIQQLQAWNPNMEAIQFSTSLIPVTRGIFVTAYARPKKKINEEEVFALYQATYADKFFVRIQPKGVYPSIKQIVGSNFCDIGIAYNEKTNIITLVAVIDNLIKGAAGQAIQNLNWMNGFPDEMGLDFVPMFP